MPRTVARSITPAEALAGTGAGMGNILIEAMTAIQIPKQTLPPWIVAAGPGGQGSVRYALIE